MCECGEEDEEDHGGGGEEFSGRFWVLREAFWEGEGVIFIR